MVSHILWNGAALGSWWLTISVGHSSLTSEIIPSYTLRLIRDFNFTASSWVLHIWKISLRLKYLGKSWHHGYRAIRTLWQQDKSLPNTNPSRTTQRHFCSITTLLLIFTKGDITLQQFKLGYLKLLYYFGISEIRLIKD